VELIAGAVHQVAVLSGVSRMALILAMLEGSEGKKCGWMPELRVTCLKFNLDTSKLRY